MDVVLYARVSSEKQAEKDLSIPAQLKALRKHALDKGWNIVAEYVDEAESARSAGRPAFREMIAAAKKKERPFEAILVWKLSRFARNREDSILYKSLLRRRGISVISINERIDDTAAGKLLEGMIEVIDEFYSSNLAQDTMRGMKENIGRGFFNGGLVAFGYKKVKVRVGAIEKVRLAPDEAEAPIVRDAFQMALEGKGSKEIAKVLNGHGVRTRAGGQFGSTIINYWLNNPVYCGMLVWNRMDRTRGSAVKKRPEEVIRVPDCHPALVSLADFNRVQELLADRRPCVRHPRTVASQYLLSGLLHCGRCGAAMIGTAAKSGKFLYYECDNHYKKGKDACTGLRVSKAKLEGFVLGKIKESILTEQNLTELIGLVNEELIRNTCRFEEQLRQVEKQQLKIKDKLVRLYTALESGKLDLDDLAPRIKELRARQRELEQRQHDILNTMKSEMPEGLDSRTVMEYVRDLENVLSGASFLQQKAFLRSFVSRLELSPPNMAIDYTIPVPVEKSRTSLEEVLRIDRLGSPRWI